MGGMFLSEIIYETNFYSMKQKWKEEEKQKRNMLDWSY